mmetsp:Transcript_605/g.1016  ORF Transcript_605/g.1016 Transcript_605/m.1016 type:complete len:131 (+) Transcript_605:309-701(+)
MHGARGSSIRGNSWTLSKVWHGCLPRDIRQWRIGAQATGLPRMRRTVAHRRGDCRLFVSWLMGVRQARAESDAECQRVTTKQGTAIGCARRSHQIARGRRSIGGSPMRWTLGRHPANVSQQVYFLTSAAL